MDNFFNHGFKKITKGLFHYYITLQNCLFFLLYFEDGKEVELKITRENEVACYKQISVFEDSRMPKLQIPTLIVEGTQSHLHSLSKEFVENNRNVIYKEVPGTHNFPMECPDLVATLISNFLNHRLSWGASKL